MGTVLLLGWDKSNWPLMAAISTSSCGTVITRTAYSNLHLANELLSGSTAIPPLLATSAPPDRFTITARGPATRESSFGPMTTRVHMAQIRCSRQVTAPIWHSALV